ncbi:MAG TPA: hypothetical protein VFP89_15855 [Propionibacteriaceae bacterium]|nr:hypothetical protein [Propionibacteriaceae bacterium]
MRLAALLVGTAIGWIGGYMSVPDVSSALSQISVALPDANVGLLVNGLGDMAPLLATAVPLGVDNFLEAMSNVESAGAAGDSYNLRGVLLADGTGAIVGAALGSPFPPAVYIGHPGWKEAGGRASYSMASGLAISLLCLLGLLRLLSAVLPLPAIVPILLYIGLLIGAQAFQAVPRLHAAAVVAAIVPNLAAWGSGLIDNALAAAGTTASELEAVAPGEAGLAYHGLHVLGQASSAGRHRPRRHRPLHPRAPVSPSAMASGVGALVSFIGLLHAEKVEWAAAPQVSLDYLLLAIVMLAIALTRRHETTAPDEVSTEEASDTALAARV